MNGIDFTEDEYKAKDITEPSVQLSSVCVFLCIGSFALLSFHIILTPFTTTAITATTSTVTATTTGTATTTTGIATC